MTQSISEIRTQIKSARQALTVLERDAAALLIAERLKNNRAIYRAKNIAAYLPVRGEVDCRFFLKSEKLRKKRIFLPVLQKSRLFFAPLIPDTEMQKNCFGILEPVYSKADLVAPDELDIVIAPLVAFDNNCNRIGMGGGYYDRSFSFRKRRRKWKRPLLIGAAYEFQRIHDCQPQSWDVPMDVVITEQQSYGTY